MVKYPCLIGLSTMRTVHNIRRRCVPEKFECPGCGAGFESYDELIDHVVEKHEAHCQICGVKTLNREELIKHNKEVHGIEA